MNPLQEEFEKQFIGRNLTEILFKKFNNLKGQVEKKLFTESHLYHLFEKFKKKLKG
jgi:hypothetical protein